MVKGMTDATRRRVSRIGSVLAPREGASPSTYEGKTYLRLLPRFLAVFCPRSGPRPAFFRRRCRSGGRMTRDAPPRPVDTLEISLGPSTVKVLTKAVQCASRIGNEILLEVVQADSLSLRSLNSARSAFFNAKFRADAFDYFRMTKPLVQVAATTKAVLAALRTPKIQMIRLALKGPDDSMLCFELSSETGLQKRYSIPTLTDVDFLNTNIDKHTYSTRLSSRPEVLSRLLSSFQAGPSDVSVTCRPQSGGKNLMFSSTKDLLRTGNTDAALNTELELSAVDEEIDYHFQGKDSQSISFNLKDFKAMVTFCSDVGTDVSVHLDDPGRPVIVASFRRASQRAESDFTVEMTLATIEDNELADQRVSSHAPPPQRERRPQHKARSAQQSPNTIHPPPTAVHVMREAPHPFSDPTRPRAPPGGDQFQHTHPSKKAELRVSVSPSVSPANRLVSLMGQAHDLTQAQAHSPLPLPTSASLAQSASHKRQWQSSDDDEDEADEECVPATPPEQR